MKISDWKNDPKSGLKASTLRAPPGKAHSGPAAAAAAVAASSAIVLQSASSAFATAVLITFVILEINKYRGAG